MIKIPKCCGTVGTDIGSIITKSADFEGIPVEYGDVLGDGPILLFPSGWHGAEVYHQQRKGPV